MPDVGPFPHGGSASTPMHTGYRPSDFRTILGASVRMVVDVGNWDGSFWINSPGQSGDPRSPHYRDLAPVWARGDYVPMLYSREAVADAAAQRIVLQPAMPGSAA
jgi:penicillin amidase